ncbi:hypothetical protein B0J14DRAFT_183400 [Halenospora varia]|nr:hypothetical protein B0J14DRAFT_183400 [Halenospora varia]
MSPQLRKPRKNVREEGKGGREGRKRREEEKGGREGRKRREEEKGGREGRKRREEEKGGREGRKRREEENKKMRLNTAQEQKEATLKLWEQTQSEIRKMVKVLKNGSKLRLYSPRDDKPATTETVIFTDQAFKSENPKSRDVLRLLSKTGLRRILLSKERHLP